MNPEFTSTIAVYFAHVEAAERIALQKSAQAQMAQDPYSYNITNNNQRFSQRSSGANSSSSSANLGTTHCLNVMVVFRRFEGGKLTDDVDLIMSLYDPKEARFITENYVVRCEKQCIVEMFKQDTAWLSVVVLIEGFLLVLCGWLILRTNNIICDLTLRNNAQFCIWDSIFSSLKRKVPGKSQKNLQNAKVDSCLA